MIINISKKDEGRFSFIGMCSFTFEKALYMLRNNKNPKKNNYKKMLKKVDTELASIQRKYKFADSKGMNATGRKAQKLMEDNYNMAKNNIKKNQNLLLIYIKKCQYEFPISNALNTSPVVDNDKDGTFEKEYRKAENKKSKSIRAGMKCVPFGAKEDHATNRIMAKIAKSYCTHVTKGKVYLETMTGRYQGSVVCHYTNGNTMPISAPLYYKSGCSRYLAY